MLEPLFQYVPLPAVIVDPDTLAIRAANEPAERHYGYTKSELLAKTLKDLTVPPLPSGAKGNSLFADACPQLCQHLTRSGRAMDVEAFWHEMLFEGRRAFLGLFLDISQHKRTEDALRQSEERFRSLANSVPAFVWTATPEGEVNYVNDQWYAYFGLDREQTAGYGWLDAIHPGDRQRCMAAYRDALQNGSSYRIEVRKRRADGQYRWFLLRAEPMRDALGCITGWFGTSIDIDDLKLAQEARARLLAQEQTLRLEAETITRDAQVANRVKDEFLATLSHELRTPLNAILGWTQTLQSGKTRKETLMRALAQIEQSAQAQAKLIDDLLNVSDIVAGRMRLEVQPMRLIPTIHAAIETLYPAINAKDIRLDTAFDPAADVVSGDPVRLRQIIWNLLSNAVKFTPRFGQIRVRLSRTDSNAVIAVRDTGEGISSEFLPYVFDRFRQADASSRKQHGGLGLGLAIVRHLVEMHGGTVEARSDGERRGSTFKVYLPIRTEWEGMRQISGELSDAGAARRARRHKLTGLRILTVDDDRNTREMLQEALERAGAEVLSADSARDALGKLKAFRPDVLVSDIGMPSEDGYDLLRQIRTLSDADGGATPAIAFTGYAREEDQSATREAGYQAVTPKPVNLDELLSTIACVAEQRLRA
ncbi:MAG TPA: PAS domain S-box protein [Burkholderiales bacterium]|nr:PAS domain S-box protein [Burkholderiales bacterium]